MLADAPEDWEEQMNSASEYAEAMRLAIEYQRRQPEPSGPLGAGAFAMQEVGWVPSG